MLVLRVAEEAERDPVKARSGTARLAPKQHFDQVDKFVFHHSLERIQAIAANNAAGRNRAMGFSIKAPKENGRRDTDFVPPLTASAVGVAGGLAT